MTKKTKSINKLQIQFKENEGSKEKAVEILSKGYRRLLLKEGKQ